MNSKQIQLLDSILNNYGFTKDGLFWTFENKQYIAVVELADDENYISVADSKTETDIEYMQFSKVSEVLDTLERYLDQ